MKLLTYIKKSSTDMQLMVLMILAAGLRFINLGYADFQGDEIKALFFPDPNKSIVEFLLSQRKGPVQFLITFLLKLVDPAYTMQFLDRLPFALAGLLAVYFFYKTCILFFNKKVSVYATFLIATNGFIVAFSRIVQYQSFVILFSILSIYYLALAVKTKEYKIKGLYFSMICWAIAILSHYDGLFVFPVLFALFIAWLKDKQILKKIKFRNTFISFSIFTAMVLVFYIPFVLFITQDTLGYWEGRLTGDVSNKLSSSYYLFTVYQPIYVIHFYLVFFIASVFGFISSILPAKVSKILTRFKPIKTFWDSVVTLYREESTTVTYLVLLAWFMLSFAFWEFIVYIPGTHIYTYLLPVFVLVAIGVNLAENFWLAVSKKIRFIKPVLLKDIVFGLITLFIFLQSYFIYVDNFKEYPWQQEQFFFWTFHTPTPIYHLSMFGFPYFRDWEGISKFISEHPDVKHYSTNERESISRHHVLLDKDTDLAGFYIYIRHPQSFTDELINEKVLYWSSRHTPVYTMSKHGSELVNIYLMEPGTVEEIKLKGL